MGGRSLTALGLVPDPMPASQHGWLRENAATGGHAPPAPRCPPPWYCGLCAQPSEKGVFPGRLALPQTSSIRRESPCLGLVDTGQSIRCQRRSRRGDEPLGDGAGLPPGTEYQAASSAPSRGCRVLVTCPIPRSASPPRSWLPRSASGRRLPSSWPAASRPCPVPTLFWSRFSHPTDKRPQVKVISSGIAQGGCWWSSWR